MRKYKLEITEYHLKLLSEISDRIARAIVGQLDYAILDICDEAISRHCPEISVESKIFGPYERTKHNLSKIKYDCWKQNENQSYGVHYSEKSDTLFDMHEVFRHQLWKDREDKACMTVDADKPFHWNKKIPLIKIEKL